MRASLDGLSQDGWDQQEEIFELWDGKAHFRYL